MEKIVNFIVGNWQYISIALVVLLDIIILILKRNKTFDSSMVSEIANLIIRAETVYGSGHGAEKLQYVIDNFDFGTHPSANTKTIKWYVDFLLCLPTKKGGFGRGKSEENE